MGKGRVRRGNSQQATLPGLPVQVPKFRGAYFPLGLVYYSPGARLCDKLETDWLFEALRRHVRGWDSKLGEIIDNENKRTVKAGHGAFTSAHTRAGITLVVLTGNTNESTLVSLPSEANAMVVDLVRGRLRA